MTMSRFRLGAPHQGEPGSARQRRGRSLAAALLAAVVTTGLAAGCSSSGGTAMASTAADTSAIPPMPSGPLEKTKLTVEVPATADTAGLYVAKYEGLFKKAGLTVTIKTATSDAQVINDQALHLHNVDIVGGNYVSFFEAQYHSNLGMMPSTNFGSTPVMDLLVSDLDIIAEGAVMNPGFAGLFVAQGSSIRSVAQLPGKTIGINAPKNIAYVMISEYLTENGINPSDVHWKVLSYSDMPKYLTDGEIQAAFLVEPYISVDQQKLGFNELTDLDAGPTSNFPLEGYAVTKDWARSYPNTLQAFLHALEQGQAIADTNRSLTQKALVAEIPGLTARDVATISLESYPVGKPDAARLQRVIDDMARLNIISGNNLTAQDLLTSSSSS